MHWLVHEGIVVVGGILLFLVGSGIAAAFGAWSLKRHPPPGAGQCVACGSDDLEVLAPGVYVCRACGYEGGENRAAWERHRDADAWSKRPWPARIAAAREKVQDALRQLLALEEDVRRWPAAEVVAAYSAAWDSAPHDRNYSATYHREKTQVARDNLTMAIRQALAPVYAAADVVPGIAVPTADDPLWEGEVKDVFGRAQQVATGALKRIDAVEAEVAGGPVDGAGTEPGGGSGADPAAT